MKISYLVALSCLVVAQPASSVAQIAGVQGTPSDPCERSPQCMQLARQGRELARAGRHDEAIPVYRAAYTIAPAPWLLYNLARRLDSAGRPEEAAAAYQSYLERAATESEDQRHKALRYLEQLRPRSGPSRGAGPGDRAATETPAGGAPPAPAQAALPDSALAAPAHKKRWSSALLGLSSFSLAALGIGLSVYLGRAPDLPDVTLRPQTN